MVRRAVALSIALIAVVALGACMVPRPPGDSPLRYRDAVFSQVDITRDLQYGSATAQNGTPTALRLDLYQPRGDTQTKRPALVWVHGGGFSGGDKADPADAGRLDDVRQARLRRRLDQLPPDLPRLRRQQHPARVLRGGDRRPARRPGCRALAAQERGRLPP